MIEQWLPMQPNATVLISLALIWFAAFAVTRITKKLRMPNVTGYIVAGILIGPYVLGLIPAGTLAGMDFMVDAALAFIAFGVGRYLRLDLLRRSGPRVILLTVCEALGAAAAVTLCMVYVFHLPLAFSLLLGAIGSATAPASSLMTIRQYRAKGPFVDTLIQVVAIDDAVALIAFSICSAIVTATAGNGGIRVMDIVGPLLYNLGAILLAVLAGFGMHRAIDKGRSKDHRLVLVCAFLFALAGFCAALGISPLLSCMVLGATYANLQKGKAVFKQVNRFTPPILALFFVLSGMRLDVPALRAAGIVGIAYFLVRILGKYAGASLGGSLTHAPEPVRRYLGLALIPQAGVSIGLALLGQRLLPEPYGQMLSTIILSSSVLYEIVGPLCAKASLFLSGSIAGAPPRPSAKQRVPLIRRANAGASESPEQDDDEGVHWSNAAQRLWACKRNEETARTRADPFDDNA